MKRFNIFSKYRNIVAKLEKEKSLSFPGVTLNTEGLDSCNMISSSQYYISYKTNGNNIGILSLNEYEKTSNGVILMGKPSIQAHSSTVNDFQFSPFAYDYLASVSSDKTLKLWEISEDGLSENLNNALVTLVHEDEGGVNMVNFHPTVENIISTATTNKVYLWDIENQKIINTFDSENEIQHYSWKEDGSLFVRSLKANGNGLEVIDPRNSGSQPITGAGHPGSKATRALWLGNSNNIVTTGFSKTRDREIFLWDTRNMGSTVFTSRMSFSPGILMPLFDSDTNQLYICGKGNNILIKYELRNNNLEDNNQLMVTNSNFCGVGLVPKRALDVMKCEIDRLLQVTKDSITPISITVPRTNMRYFIPEIFPDTKGDESALTTEEWINGLTKEVKKLSLDPAKSTPAKSHNKNAKPKTTSSASTTVEPPKPSSGPVMPIQVSVGATVTPTRSNPLASKPNPISTKPNPVSAKPNPLSASKPNPVNSGSSSSESLNKRANPLNSSSESLSKKANPLNRSSSSVNVSENNKKDEDTVSTPASAIAMKFGAQASSFRFMSGKVKVQYDNLSGYWDNLTNEIEGIEVNDKFMAIPINGPGGRIAVLKTRDSGRIPSTMNCILCGSTMTYYKFNPFNPNMLVTGNENGNVQIWTIPDEGLTENLTEPDHSFSLFNSKTTLIEFNPLVENLVLVGGYDIGTGSNVLKLLDLGKKEEVFPEHEDKLIHPDFILNASWNYDGTKIATLCRDKNLRVIDMVKGEILKEGIASESNKGRVRWLGKTGKILSVGFDKQSHQEIKIFDENDLSKPLTTLSIDLSSSLLCVYFDEDTNLIYLYGRGESNIKVYEFMEDQDPCCRTLLKINTESIQQGIVFDHKKYLDVAKVEINRAWVVSKDNIKSISFTVPRTRTEFFQDDIFPPTRDTEHSSMTIDAWKSGKITPLKTIDLCPEGMKPLSENNTVKVIKSTAHLIRKAGDKSNRNAKDEFVSQLMSRVIDDEENSDSDGGLEQDKMEGLDDDEWD
ncbi:DUF1900-domain-containing protein [Anaeromyces robustus]|uniref:Coronin n=1 Tax=Anaeromyces robustus TaxID=1754192 RepID=A0A1Y1WZZ2_9FUNG|nr:DUF1900-domain-containing protein [Anaeromyces robustus]|eukprot:ORX79121.1 DUF1900-domain-containing protein [Anaeromyces robustus]